MNIRSIGNESRINYHVNTKQTQPVFGRKWEIHKSWGANFDKDKGITNFKLFSDAKAVFVEVADKAVVGLENIKSRIVQVIGAVGAGLELQNVLSKDSDSKIYPMVNKGDGIFEAEGIDAKPDDKYRYIVLRNNNEVNLVKDPYAKKQENIHGWSSVYDSDNYEWKNTNWLNGKDPRRIVRNPKDEVFHGLAGLRIDEINIPTLTEEGTFKAALPIIDKIAEDGIANAIEIMPVENTYSKQWGYDGVDKFAINEKLGTHAELKELIDYAHGKGLNVIMDMVPNHMGPDGDYLAQTGPYEVGPGQFGAKFNFEKQHNKYVRDWMANAALWWANEFKVDGIRFDMTKETASDYLLKQIVDELNEHNPKVFLIAEDGRDNKLSITRYDDSTNSHEEKINNTDLFIDLISKGARSTPHAIGFDSEWDFLFMHALKDAITHNNQTSIGLIDERMKNSAHRIKYIMSHDEIGNVDGTRLLPKVLAQYLNLFGNISGYSDADRGQKAAKLSYDIVKIITTKADVTDEELAELQKNYGMQYIFNKETLTNALMASLAKSRLAAGSLFSIPGPKMFFQGEEYGDLSYFRFFRDFSPEFESYPQNAGLTDKINWEKGYNVSTSSALKESILNKDKPNGDFAKMQKQMLLYNKDWIRLIDANPALQDGILKSVYRDHDNLVHIHSVEKGDNKLLIFKNYADKFHKKSYSTLGFPKDEKYIEIFNSDDVKYGGGGIHNRGRHITSDNQNLNLAANSIIVLKKID